MVWESSRNLSFPREKLLKFEKSEKKLQKFQISKKKLGRKIYYKTMDLKLQHQKILGFALFKNCKEYLNLPLSILSNYFTLFHPFL